MKLPAFIFALVAVPFIGTWTLTQGPKLLDRAMPVYAVTGIGSVEENRNGITLRNVTWKKLRACTPDGLMYVSANYQDEHKRRSEMLLITERDEPGQPYMVTPKIAPGETLTDPQIRVVISHELLEKLDGFRFVISCHRPFIGAGMTYTNLVKLNDQ